MTLRQQIVQDRIDKTAEVLTIQNFDFAFLRLCHSIITSQSLHSFDEKDFVDGGQDKQIDVITIERNEREATVYILQVKNTRSFSSNALMQMQIGMDWIFNRSRSDILNLKNIKLSNQIIEYREVQNELGPDPPPIK